MPERQPLDFRYAALIRAHEFRPLIGEVVEKLRAQSAPPEKIIIVDSSKDPVTTEAFASIADIVVPYGDAEFNFSKALNIGVAANEMPHTFVLSSHVLLDDQNLIENGWHEARQRDLEIVFWTRADTDLDQKRIEISKRNFNGRNGMGNTSAMIPTHLLQARPFREEVFSAEDQEWTKYYLRAFKRPILRVQTMGLRYLNPNHGSETWSHVKLLNEELAIGHFVNRRLIMPDRIFARFCRGVLATIRRRPERARMHFSIAKSMLSANFVPPKRQSRYF